MELAATVALLLLAAPTSVVIGALVGCRLRRYHVSVQVTLTPVPRVPDDASSLTRHEPGTP